MNSLYYESHVTIEPVFDERLIKFVEICASYKFLVANLLMQKRKEETPEKSKYDSFCTGRDSSFPELEHRMMGLLTSLKKEGFKIYRYKIESAVLDSRYNDSKFPIKDKHE